MDAVSVEASVELGATRSAWLPLDALGGGVHRLEVHQPPFVRSDCVLAPKGYTDLPSEIRPSGGGLQSIVRCSYTKLHARGV